MSTLLGLTVALIVALVGLSMLEDLRARLAARAALHLDEVWGPQIFRSAISKPGAGVKDGPRALDATKSFVGGPAALALADLPWVPVYVVFCFALQPLLGLLALIAIAVLCAMTVAAQRRAAAPLARGSEVAAELRHLLEYVGSEGGTIRALGMVEGATSRLIYQRQRLLRCFEASNRAARPFHASGRFLRLLLQSGSLGLGAVLSLSGHISQGAVFAASLLIGRALGPVDQLLANWRTVVDARNALPQLYSALEGGSLDAVRMELPRPDGNVRLERVIVAGRLPGEMVLRVADLSIHAGEFVGVVGPSGSGKSTLAALIAGAMSPSAGSIRIDGSDIGDWNREQLGGHIGYVPQRISFMPGSIRDNIARFQGGRSRATVDEQVLDVARMCGIHEFVQRLPSGYQTQLGPRAAGLSAGEAQRVAIARALYGQPRILVLDEPNANLDVDSERSLMRVLAKCKAAGSTIICVVHRPALLSLADRILTLRNGAPVAFDRAPSIKVPTSNSDRDASGVPA